MFAQTFFRSQYFETFRPIKIRHLGDTEVIGRKWYEKFWWMPLRMCAFGRVELIKKRHRVAVSGNRVKVGEMVLAYMRV